MFGVFTYCAENGVDLERIASIDPGGHRTRVAVYAGGINERIDFDLLNNTVKSNPDWLFIVAGGGPRLCEIGDAPNLHKLGNVDYEDVLRILKASAVGMIPFRESEYVKSSSLMKLVDYLACGVKVVVTPAVHLGRMANAAGEQILVVERSAWSDAFQGLGSVVSNEDLDLSSFSVQARSSRMLGIVAEVSA
nr:glycosyltransferase [Rhodococcus sp. 105337]